MKIEIEIRDDIKPEQALDCVRQVVEEGKISKGDKGKMYYCWASIFEVFNTMANRQDYNIVVVTQRYRKNDCFVVLKEKRL